MEIILTGVAGTVISAAIIGAWGWVVYLLKQAAKDRKAQNAAQKDHNQKSVQADLAILYDKLKYLCEKHIGEGYCSIENRKNLTCLYQAYEEIGGNGFIAALYERAIALPMIKED